ncbi:disulfide isomerase DsbC N-terminal domain-containing protein [Pseudoalteromonas galatheae]|uniref:disulfide isomerase DsbC N-terminal domain-containing protein n=1 Tax=Pseudoalteromonas galatheae TaxID=579562 RepID=UPI0030CC563A
MKWLSLVLSIFCFHSLANDLLIEDAESKLKATFKNLQFTSFKPGPIDGIYEINTGGQIIYFHPKAELLLMGEFYTKNGRNLTAESIASSATLLSEKLPIADALIVEGKASQQTLIEFTDPNCGYCKSYDRFVTEPIRSDKIKRVVFFDSRGSEDSRKKAIHILCSDSPSREMKKIYHGILPSSYLSCEEGIRLQKVHEQAVKLAGTRGTPSFIIDGKLTLGFRPSVKEFLNNL